MKVELVGTQEAAAILSVEVPRITRWRKAEKMPPTVADLAATPVWRKVDVEKLRDDKRWSGRAPRKMDLAGTSEAAERIGEILGRKIDKSQIGRWRRAGTFPSPAYRLSASPVWTGEQIERFAEPRRAAAAAA